MAIGDVKSDLKVIPQGGILTIQPPVGEEWVIHNIYYTSAVQFRLGNNGSFLQYDLDSSQGARLGLCIHVTNQQYLQVLNGNTGNTTIAFDGIQTK